MKGNPHPSSHARQQGPIVATDSFTSGEITTKSTVKSGLRPKKKPKLTSDSTSSQQSIKKAIKSNVFDAYYDHILPKMPLIIMNCFHPPMNQLPNVWNIVNHY